MALGHKGGACSDLRVDTQTITGTPVSSGEWPHLHMLVLQLHMAPTAGCRLGQSLYPEMA